MALDESRTRQRIAAALLAARAKLGGGDARRFPQPKMADLLDVSLRTYQHWESAETMPRWRNLEEIASKLEIEVSDLLGADELVPEAAEPPVQPSDVQELREEVGELRAAIARVERLLRDVLPAGQGSAA